MNNNITQYGKNATHPKSGRGSTNEGTLETGIAPHQAEIHSDVPSQKLQKTDKLRRRHSFDDNGGGYMGL